MQNFKFLRVNVCELRLVLDVDVDCAFSSAAANSACANRDGAGNFAIRRIHCSDVAAAAVHGRRARPPGRK